MNTYSTTVTDDNYVIVIINGVDVDHCGPWDSNQGAHLWAAAIVADLENGIDHYGLNQD